MGSSVQHRYLTAHQVAEMLQLNVESIYDLAGRSELPATKICGRWRFDVVEIHEWFRANRPQSESGKESPS